MLKHTETEPIPAAKVRVTPQELADAIATLQAHKEGMEGTISLGDAVQELSLDETPEEVLRVVQERREQKQREQTGVRRKTKRTRRLVLAAALLAVFPVVHTMRQQVAHTPSAAISAPAPAQGTTLVTVPDEQQAFVETSGLEQILQGKALNQVPVFSSSQGGIRWSIIKHDGRIYVHGYAFQLSEKQVKSKTFDVYNAEDADLTGRESGYIVKEGTMYPDVKVTLPVGSFHCEDVQRITDQAKITVSDVHPDSHLWDSFTDRFAP